MKSCNRKILELFYNAKHSGRIMKPDAIGRFGENDEGLVIELTWRVIGGVIADAKFRAFGNPNAIAIASLMTGSIIGKSIEDALAIDEQVIIDALDEFRPEYLEVYDVMRECISDAYNNYIKRQERKEYAEEVIIDDYIPEQQDEDLDEQDVQDYIAKQVQREIRVTTKTTASRGRGRPRKEIDPNAVVEVGPKRGRGRPRKEIDPNAEVVETVKRGRGRPRKEVDPNAIVEVGPKRGRGRPRKEIDPDAIVVVGEKRGRGRPRKEIDPNVEVVETVKRGRGRPRKEIDPNAIVEVGPKRGRGRPRKEVDPNAVVEVGPKRGRGRPRKVVEETVKTISLQQVVLTQNLNDEESFNSNVKAEENVIADDIEQTQNIADAQHISQTEVVETVKRGRGRPRKQTEEVFKIVMGEKRGRGRPRKEVKYNFPTDLDEVEYDEDMQELINGSANKYESVQSDNDIVANLAKDVDVDSTDTQPKASGSILDDDFDDYDLFKSNIRNILSGKEVKSAPEKAANEVTVTQEVKSTTVNSNEFVQEKRGRGRPKKEFASNTGRINTPASASSITRSLSPNGMPSHNTQDILFASKNVTTTNINTAKSTTTESQVVRYSISEVKKEVEVSIPKQEPIKDEEIEIEPVEVSTKFANFEDDFDDMEADNVNEDTSKIKDEAPAGGLSDLLKALLDD